MTTRVHRPEDLPDFRYPPLVETVLSLQFKPLERFSLVHVGLLWHQFRSKFPLIEEHSPLPVARESFEAASHGQIEVSIEERPPVPRVWFLNESESPSDFLPTGAALGILPHFQHSSAAPLGKKSSSQSGECSYTLSPL